MKKTLLSLMFSAGVSLYAQQSSTSSLNCDHDVTLNSNYSKAAALDSIMKKYAPGLLPGIAIAVYSEAEGWWAGAQGYAKVESKLPMQNCHLQYLQSMAKTYVAVEMLQLKEQEKIRLDSPITKYLSSKYTRYLKSPGKITVRMLLNQVSGIPEYTTTPAFISQVIQHPLNYFSGEDCLKSIADEPSQFAPGSKYQYTNTNYLLLALIGNGITGDHAAYIKKNVFKPLGLNNTYYGNDYNYLKGLNVPDSYWDMLNVGRPANITQFQQATVVSSKGDDGIVSTPIDAVKFWKGLMEGKLLKPESMQEMMNFVKDEQGRSRYGMGVIYFDLDGIIGYGHGGGGIGAGCGLIYFPSKKTYVFFATNLGVFVEGDLVKKADEMKNAVLATILQ
ncbi:MAG: serine hydrolase domain-containing protein [Chitinophagaceae bacterium]